MADFDLEKLKAEGWRVYIKKVKGKEYFIAKRKPPGQKKRISKSLGRNNPELLKKLEDLDMIATKRVKVHTPVEDASPVGSSADIQKQINAANETIKKLSNQLKKKNDVIERLKKENSRAKRLKEGRGPSYTLSKSQFSRLSGISHLERGKRPSIIIDELLTMELKCRKYGISFAKLRKMYPFLNKALSRKWTPKMLTDCITGLWNQNIHTQPPKTVKKLIELVEIIQKRKWKLNDFVNYATNYHNQIYWSGKYERREISKERFMQEMKAYV